MRRTGEILIERPPAVVFAYLADVSNWTAIDESVVSVEPVAPLHAGATGTAVSQRPGLKVSATWEITAMKPGETLETLYRGPGYAIRETVRLGAAADGTNVHITDTLEPTSLFGRFLVGVSGRTVSRSLETRSRRLKELVESA